MSKGYDQFFKAAKQAKGLDQKTGARAKVTPSSTSEKPKREVSEEELRRKLRVQPRKKVKKPTPPVPWTAMTLSFCAVLLSGWFLLEPETFEQAWKRIEIRWGGMAQASEEKEKISPTSDPKAANSSPGEKTNDSVSAKESASAVQQDLSYFSKLNERKKELDNRESELNALEEELHRQREEIEMQIKRLEDMRRQIASVLQERVEIDEEKVNKLVEVYSNMKASQAAEIIATLNEDLAVEVLGRMKKKNAADILNVLEPSKAQSLSEKYAGYKKR